MYYKENTVTYLNGEWIKASDAKTDLYSQTMHYGYGVFEGIRSYNTADGVRIFKAEEHYQRLIYSAKKMHHIHRPEPKQKEERAKGGLGTTGTGGTPQGPYLHPHPLNPAGNLPTHPLSVLAPRRVPGCGSAAPQAAHPPTPTYPKAPKHAILRG